MLWYMDVCVYIYIYLYIHLHQVNCQSLFWLLLFQSLLCLGWVPRPVLATTRAKQTCQGYSSTFCTHKLIASHSTIVGSCLLGSFLSKGCVVHKWNSTAVSLHFFQVIPGPPEVDHWSDHWKGKTNRSMKTNPDGNIFWKHISNHDSQGTSAPHHSSLLPTWPPSHLQRSSQSS